MVERVFSFYEREKDGIVVLVTVEGRCLRKVERGIRLTLQMFRSTNRTQHFIEGSLIFQTHSTFKLYSVLLATSQVTENIFFT